MSGLAGLVQRYRAGADPLRSERRVELVALVLGLLLFMQLVFSGLRLLLLPEPAPVAPSADLLEVGQSGLPVADEGERAAVDSQVIRARPLFWSSRLPADPTEEQAPEVAEVETTEVSDLKEVHIVGIFGVGEDAGIITLVKGKKQRILLGEEIEGWTLDAIKPDRAILKNKGRTQGLQLKPSLSGDER